MSEQQVDAEGVINELLEQLKQANLQIAMLKVMLVTAKKEQAPTLEF
jgi:hypothetical protein